MVSRQAARNKRLFVASYCGRRQKPLTEFAPLSESGTAASLSGASVRHRNPVDSTGVLIETLLNDQFGQP